MIHFKINRREFESDRRQVRAMWLAEQAGLDPTGFELVRTTTGETWRDPSAAVELRDGDAFEAKGRVRPVEPSIRYTVNGELQVTKESPLTVEELLRRAGAGRGDRPRPTGGLLPRQRAHRRQVRKPR